MPNESILFKRPREEEYISKVKIDAMEISVRYVIKGITYGHKTYPDPKELKKSFENPLKDRFFKLMVEMSRVILAKHTDFEKDLAVWEKHLMQWDQPPEEGKDNV